MVPFVVPVVPETFCQNGPDLRAVFRSFDVFENSRVFRYFPCFPGFTRLFTTRDHGISPGTHVIYDKTVVISGKPLFCQ